MIYAQLRGCFVVLLLAMTKFIRSATAPACRTGAAIERREHHMNPAHCHAKRSEHRIIDMRFTSRNDEVYNGKVYRITLFAGLPLF